MFRALCIGSKTFGLAKASNSNVGRKAEIESCDIYTLYCIDRVTVY